jgi:hypothetical protein
MMREFTSTLPMMQADSIDFYREYMDTPRPGPTGYEMWTEQVTHTEIYLDGIFSIMQVPENKKYSSDGLNCGLMYFHGGGGLISKPEHETN